MIKIDSGNIPERNKYDNRSGINTSGFWQVFPSDLIIPEEKMLSNMQKGFHPKRMKALKIMRFLGLVASQRGLFHPLQNSFLKKSVAKTVVQKVPSPETRINTGFFGTSKPRGTIPTRCRKAKLNAFCL